ncbi:potassium transporter [Iocasia frigidifontis]|uniref:Potassium transporter n=1 Tax=Iocasia fonsfrigidae TaxID=2682810 RepID=A0A8A7KJM5_9FIRM|nr:potassium channel family protein [Iocasia fonsfrigidae]QTL99809.1 potassium transporter [Iocasia fonsfrigidae]
MFNVLLGYFKRFKTQIDPKLLFRMLLLGIIIFLIIAFIVYNIEPQDQFNSLADAIWWVVVTATTVGYGDFFPVSVGGRLLAVVLMVLGIGLFGGITATITDLFIKIEKRRELGQLTADYKGHIIICGWCEKTSEIIRQILNEDIENKQIVLIADLERDPFPDNNLVHFIRGEIDDKEILEKANIQWARTAIILNEDNNDATTVLSALTINSLNSTLYSIAEISKEENRIHLQNAGVDEIVVNNDISSRLMVRTAFYHGTSIVFNELLTNKIGNEVYMLKVEKEYADKSFAELFTYLKQKENAILLGLKRGDNVLLNPDNSKLVLAGDYLIYMALKRIDNFCI